MSYVFACLEASLLIFWSLNRFVVIEVRRGCEVLKAALKSGGVARVGRKSTHQIFGVSRIAVVEEKYFLGISGYYMIVFDILELVKYVHLYAVIMSGEHAHYLHAPHDSYASAPELVNASIIFYIHPLEEYCLKICIFTFTAALLVKKRTYLRAASGARHDRSLYKSSIRFCTLTIPFWVPMLKQLHRACRQRPAYGKQILASRTDCQISFSCTLGLPVRPGGGLD
jgi:hypothetical protein